MYKNFYIATKNLYVKAIHRAHRKKGIETAALRGYYEKFLFLKTSVNFYVNSVNALTIKKYK